MELATNQFNKGLQMDTNPMVLGNDTLTDCLNGTLITMNGNEVILLNDMGNRRVSDAFLPPGYLPVGMKEYGGIIYVAAYNPITNKSLIGSFPSPLRKINSLSEAINPVPVNFDRFFNEGNVTIDPTLNIKILKLDSFMYPMSQNIQIHSGDKFVVYAEGLSEISHLISNYNNTSDDIVNYSNHFYSTRYENRIFSPKNKKYTLLLGILNSQNEFVDITKTLERWNNKGEIIPTSEESEELKFNHGYFIPDSFSEGLQGETENDAKLLLERLNLSTNTYSYKLVGPLYLKVIYNHILNFSYSISASISPKEEDSSKKILELVIDGNITYNCPDRESSEEFPFSVAIPRIPQYEKYWTYGETKPSNKAFLLIDYENSLVNTTVSKSKYDPATNLYSAEITKEYRIELESNSNIFSYTIGVLADLDNPNPVYLKECSVSGLLDLSLLESAIVSVREWRFLNDVTNRKSTLLYNFNSYPKKNEYFDNLKFHFDEIVEEGNTPDSFVYPTDFGIEEPLPVPNGRNIITIDWGSHFKERAAYKVTISYCVINKNTGESRTISLKEGDLKRWFLTTKLFNGFSKMLDLCNSSTASDSALLEFYEKLKVPYTCHAYAEEEGAITNPISSEEGNFFAPKNLYAEYKVSKESNKKIFDIEAEVSLENLLEYPSFVGISSQYSICLNSINGIKIGDLYINLESGVYKVSNHVNIGESFDSTKILDFKNRNLIEVNIQKGNSDYIEVGYKAYNYYYGKEQYISEISNLFVPLMEKVLGDYLPIEDYLPTSNYYGGIYPETVNISHLSTNDMSYPYLKIWHNLPNYSDNYTETEQYVTLLVGGDAKPNSSLRIWELGFDNNVYNNLYNEFNTRSHLLLTIQFIFPKSPVKHYFPISGSINSYLASDNTNARVWWKGKDNKWYPSRRLLKKSDWEGYLNHTKDLNFFREILGIGTENYVFSPKKSTTSNIPIGVATPNYSAYTSEYNLPLFVNANFKSREGVTIKTISWGNLVFESNISDITELVKIEDITSSPMFLNRIEHFDFSDIKNICIYREYEGLNPVLRIKTYDAAKLDLDPNFVYSINGTKLHKISEYSVLTIEKTNNRVPVLGSTIGTMGDDYDEYYAGENYSRTRLKYKDIPCIPYTTPDSNGEWNYNI